ELEAQIAAEVKQDIDEATDYAENADDPTSETAMKWVYAEDWPGETPPTWGMGGGHEADAAGEGGGH
ncbi:MAG: hypothetical protein ABUL57_02645, partial [Chloroflexota bacterium]